jgi:general stress protein 26
MALKLKLRQRKVSGQTRQRVRDIIGRLGVCMLTTHFADGLRARPIEARLNRSRYIYFVTDVDSAKHSEIDATPDVGLAFVDAKRNTYLSITGRARVIRDTAIAKAVWRKTDAVWWPGGPADPDVRLLRVEPLLAELWDGPSSAARTIYEFAKAFVTGEEPALGENRKTTIEM